VSSKHTAPAATGSVDGLRADIAGTRADLGDTAAALADKADVKGRAKASARQAAAKVQDTGRQAAAQVGETAQRTARRRPVRWATVAAGATVAAAVGVLTWRRRTRPTPKTRAARAWRFATDRFRR
jgi:ElaB/YqjD/DUF883 family membrane-anchored ribosome-binding protein